MSTTKMMELKDGQKIDIDKLRDTQVVLHPEIGKWRDSLTVDLRLLNSLKEGQIQPIIFRETKDGKYELLVGSRRYFHQKLLGAKWEDIPKEIKKRVSERNALMMAASENIFRKDFNPWEEARAINSLLIKGKIKARDLANKLGVSQSYITSRRALLQLPEKIRGIFEKKNVPIGYATPVKKLEGEAQETLVEKIVASITRGGYYGVSTIEDAEKFVTEAKQKIKHMEELVAKYGSCPKCGSKKLSDARWGNEDQLSCGDCGHQWHKETKEPWEYWMLKQRAQEMGFNIEEGPEKLKLTPKEVAEMIDQQAEAERKSKEGEKEILPAKFRSKAPLLTLLQPMIDGDNIQKLEVADERIEIQLIEGFGLYFKGLRKDYKAGEKARIETTGWSGEESIEKNHEWVKNLTKE